MAIVRGHRCELVPRNDYRSRGWPQLAEEIAHAVRAHHVLLDGEICCVEPDGRTHFNKLPFRRDWLFFYFFDVLAIEGDDVKALPLIERKRRLLAIMPAVESRLLYLDHVHERGRDLFRVSCERDLEGIVGKWAEGTYRTDGRATSWLKIKNGDYTQIVDRHELFAHRQRHEVRRRSVQFRVGSRSALIAHAQEAQASSRSHPRKNVLDCRAAPDLSSYKGRARRGTNSVASAVMYARYASIHAFRSKCSSFR